MNRFKTICLIALILAAAHWSSPNDLCAQGAFDQGVRRGGLTDGLISRGELRGLLDRPVTNQNPLRHRAIAAPTRAQNLPTQSLPTQTRAQRPPVYQPAPVQAPAPPIHDPLVTATSWQEETPEAQTYESATFEPQALTQQEAEADVVPFGPAPSPEMQLRWQEMDLLVDFSVEKLVQEISERRRKLDASLGIDEQAKNDLLTHLEVAESASQKAMQYLSKKDALQDRILAFDEELERLRQDAKTAIELPAIDDSLSVDQMQVQMRNLQAEADYEELRQRDIEEQIQQRDKRMEAIPREGLKNRNDVHDFHELLLQKQATGTSNIEELLSIRARELAASTKVQLLDEEAHWNDLSQEKLPLEKAINQRRLHSLQQELKSWNQRIAKCQQHELELEILAARQNAFATHPALREFSLETSRLTQGRVDIAAITNILQTEKLKVTKQHEDVDQHLKRLKKLEEVLKKGGDSESDETLIEVHRNLAPPWESMARIRQLKREISENRSTKLHLREELDEISDPEVFIVDRLGITEDLPVADTTLVAMAEEAIENHRQQLVALVGDHEKVHSLLNEIKSHHEATQKNIKATRKMVDLYALWVQDAAPINVDLLNESRQGASEFFDSQQWSELGQSVITSVQQRPWRPTVGMCGLLLAFVIGRRFKG